jgi:hypothetical protein
VCVCKILVPRQTQANIKIETEPLPVLQDDKRRKQKENQPLSSSHSIERIDERGEDKKK